MDDHHGGYESCVGVPLVLQLLMDFVAIYVLCDRCWFSILYFFWERVSREKCLILVSAVIFFRVLLESMGDVDQNPHFSVLYLPD